VSALAAERVVKRFGAVVALDAVSLEVGRGECLGVIGESGSGKTTLLRCFNRLVEPDAGRILVGGADAATLDPIELRRGTGYVPQDGGLLPHWAVRRNVALVPWLRGSAEADDAAERAMRLVGLEPERFGDRRPRELSGGERQRVAVARALAAGPEVVLLDEPFGALDAFTREELWVALRDLQAARKVTVMLVTHDLREAVFLADTVYVMSSRPGRILRRRAIPFPRPRDLEVTYTQQFQDIVHELRGLIGRG